MTENMTDYAENAKKACNKYFESSRCMKIALIVSALLAFGVFSMATVYLGIYAYKNPDPDNCWVVREL